MKSGFSLSCRSRVRWRRQPGLAASAEGTAPLSPPGPCPPSSRQLLLAVAATITRFQACAWRSSAGIAPMPESLMETQYQINPTLRGLFVASLKPRNPMYCLSPAVTPCSLLPLTVARGSTRCRLDAVPPPRTWAARLAAAAGPGRKPAGSAPGARGREANVGEQLRAEREDKTRDAAEGEGVERGVRAVLQPPEWRLLWLPLRFAGSARGIPTLHPWLLWALRPTGTQAELCQAGVVSVGAAVEGIPR